MKNTVNSISSIHTYIISVVDENVHFSKIDESSFLWFPGLVGLLRRMFAPSSDFCIAAVSLIRPWREGVGWGRAVTKLVLVNLGFFMCDIYRSEIYQGSVLHLERHVV